MEAVDIRLHVVNVVSCYRAGESTVVISDKENKAKVVYSLHGVTWEFVCVCVCEKEREMGVGVEEGISVNFKHPRAKGKL